MKKLDYLIVSFIYKYLIDKMKTIINFFAFWLCAFLCTVSNYTLFIMPSFSKIEHRLNETIYHIVNIEHILHQDSQAFNINIMFSNFQDRVSGFEFLDRIQLDKNEYDLLCWPNFHILLMAIQNIYFEYFLFWRILFGLLGKPKPLTCVEGIYQFLSLMVDQFFWSATELPERVKLMLD